LKIDEQTRQKKHVVFLAALSGPHPSSTPNRNERVSFCFYLAFFLFTSLLLSSAGLLSLRVWALGQGAMVTSQLFSSFVFPSRSSEKTRNREKRVGLDFKVAAATQTLPDWKPGGTTRKQHTHNHSSPSLSLMRFPFSFVQAADTLADDRDGWVDKGQTVLQIWCSLLLRKKPAVKTHNDTLIPFVCVVFL
jgi:hypothetical protein